MVWLEKGINVSCGMIYSQLGAASRSGITNNDANSAETAGVYAVNANENPSNLPVLGYGLLIVIGKAESLFQIQLYCISETIYYRRRGSNGYTGVEWTKIN